MEAKAAREIPMEGTKYLVPWFVISKMEGDTQKNRLISDCREINHYFSPKKFKLDTIQTIFPFLQRGMYGAKVDLKDAYFHLKLAPHLKEFVRLQVGENQWEFQGACFGVSTLPQLWMSTMNVLEKICINITMI